MLALFVASPAEAQLLDLIKKGERLLGREEVKQGLEMAQAMTRDFTEEEEVEIGRIISASILATYPLSTDDALQRYMTLVGNTVAMYSERPSLEWHFAVIEARMVNAYSAPGGYINPRIGFRRSRRTRMTTESSSPDQWERWTLR